MEISTVDSVINNTENIPDDHKVVLKDKKRNISRNSHTFISKRKSASRIPKPNFSAKASPERKRSSQKGNEENSIPTSKHSIANNYNEFNSYKSFNKKEKSK